MSKEIATSLQAEYMQLDREVRKLYDDLQRKRSRMQRIEAIFNQHAALRRIHDKKFTEGVSP